MNSNRSWRWFFRWLAGIAVITGLLAAMAAPALALTGEISLSETLGPVGTRVTVTGTGFTEGSFYTILFNGSSVSPANADNRVGDGGVFSNSFIVPSLPSGRYPVTVTTGVDDSQVKHFEIKVVEIRVVINPQITINSTSGKVGDTVTVGGTGFTAASSASILFDGALIGSRVTTGAGGVLPATVITIPEAAGGAHTISASDITDVVSPSQSYTISPKITVNPTSGGVGDQITVSGNGFGASQNLGVYFDNALVVAGVTASARGVLSPQVFNIPSSGPGSHTVEVKGGANSVTATITVSQKITVSPLTGPVGTVVSVSGTGFTASQPLSVKFNGAAVTTTPATLAVAADGSFSGSFTVSGAAGSHAVEISDGTLTSSQDFTVVIAGTLEPKAGNVGTTIAVEASGFTPNATVTITLDGKDVTTAKVDATGAFKSSFPAPAVKGGEHQIAAGDGTNSFGGAFTMEATAPPAPGLVLPKDKSSGGRTPSFQWGVVADPSGVTYDFQLATDAGFTSLLFDKKGLTDTKFVISEADKLEPAKKDAPYYWRVKAIDGATNESDWSAPLSFYTGFSLSLPTWAIYALIVIGVLLVGFIGFWLGRRSAWYS